MGVIEPKFKTQDRSAQGKLDRQDFYIEQPWAVDLLLDWLKPADSHLVYDPAVGSGTVRKACGRRGLTSFGSDIKPRSDWVQAIADFPAQPGLFGKVDHVITNPPFSLAEPFHDAALPIATRSVCLLLRLAFLEGQERANGLFKRSPPSWVLVFAGRLSMPPGELYEAGQIEATGGKVAYAWFVWFADMKSSNPRIGWLVRE